MDEFEEDDDEDDEDDDEEENGQATVKATDGEGMEKSLDWLSQVRVKLYRKISQKHMRNTKFLPKVVHSSFRLFLILIAQFPSIT